MSPTTMSNSVPANHTLSASISHHPTEALIATIADNALLLYLPQSDTHSVWRFDLDAIAEHGFRVTGRDGYYELDLCTLDGTETRLARFLDKQEALQTLQLIHSALQRVERASTGGGSSVPAAALATCPLPIMQSAMETAAETDGSTLSARRGCCRKMAHGMTGWLTFWRLVFLLALAALLFYVLRPAETNVGTPGATTAQAPINAPSGVPLDADSVLAD